MTNDPLESRKARALAVKPYALFCFYWASRQKAGPRRRDNRGGVGRGGRCVRRDQASRVSVRGMGLDAERAPRVASVARTTCRRGASLIRGRCCVTTVVLSGQSRPAVDRILDARPVATARTRTIPTRWQPEDPQVGVPLTRSTRGESLVADALAPVSAAREAAVTSDRMPSAVGRQIVNARYLGRERFDQRRCRRLELQFRFLDLDDQGAARPGEHLLCPVCMRTACLHFPRARKATSLAWAVTSRDLSRRDQHLDSRISLQVFLGLPEAAGRNDHDVRQLTVQGPHVLAPGPDHVRTVFPRSGNRRPFCPVP